VNHANTEGYAALDAACRAGSVEGVRLLVKAGADVNHCDGNGDAALSAAAMDAHEDVMRLLLGAGAQVSKRETNRERCSALDGLTWRGVVI
jgi:ankyrin repeat protein